MFVVREHALEVSKKVFAAERMVETPSIGLQERVLGDGVSRPCSFEGLMRRLCCGEIRANWTWSLSW